MMMAVMFVMMVIALGHCDDGVEPVFYIYTTYCTAVCVEANVTDDGNTYI